MRLLGWPLTILVMHVGEVGLRIDAVELAGFDQRGDDRPMLRRRDRSRRTAHSSDSSAISQSFCPSRAGCCGPISLASAVRTEGASYSERAARIG